MKKDTSYVNKATNSDPFYVKRQKRLRALRDDIKNGNVIMYDFDTNMDELIEELSNYSS